MNEASNKGVEVMFLSDIKKSGVVLEAKVSSIFQKTGKNWGIEPNHYFADLDSGKSREVDMSNIRELDINDSRLELVLSLEVIVECKKVPGNAWVFFQPEGGLRRHRSASVDVGVRTRPEDRTYDSSSVLEHIFGKHLASEAWCILYRESIVDRGKSNGRTDNLYKGLMTVSKAAESLRRDDKTSYSDNITRYAQELFHDGKISRTGDVDKNEDIVDFMDAQLPLIVFEGEMYSINSEPETLKPVDHATVSVSYKSKKYDMRNVSIDICKLSYLPTYLLKIEEAFLEVQKVLATPGGFYPQGWARYQRRFSDSMNWFENRRVDMCDRLREAITARTSS